MTPSHLPDDHDAPDFGPDDDPYHTTQSGWWLGFIFIAAVIAVARLIVWLLELGGH